MPLMASETPATGATRERQVRPRIEGRTSSPAPDRNGAAPNSPRDAQLWSHAAPDRLKSLAASFDDPETWRAWQRHVARRRRPRPIAELFSGKTHPLLWSFPDDAQAPGLRELIEAIRSANGNSSTASILSLIETLLQRGSPQRIAAQKASEVSDPESVLGLVALAHLLPSLCGNVPCDAWWKILTTLCNRAQARRVPSLDGETPAALAWADQVLCGELPWTLAHFFPELRVCAALAQAARTTLSEGLVGLTDGEGLPHARHLPWLRPLYACWTRCLGMAPSAGIRPFSDEADVQYAWLVRQALKLTRSDGSQLLGSGPACRWQPELFRAALDLAGDEEDLAAAALALPSDLKIPASDELPCEAAVESEWSELAVLRSDWSRTAPRLAVDFSGPDVRIELEVGREVLLGGTWRCDVSANGVPLAREAEWSEVCWFSDDEVDYLEISAELDGGGSLERQMLLAREDRFLFLCDNVIGASRAPLECRSILPLSPAAACVCQPETREVEIAGRGAAALALPLALPEWKVDPRFGALELDPSDRSGLLLRQHTSGPNLACPLFLDLLPRRYKRQRTWRQLTVAESLAICPRETAVAYRVQCGLAQWILYRSLAPAGNRTFFGHNVATEFYAGRFHRDGEVEEMLEIEQE